MPLILCRFIPKLRPCKFYFKFFRKFSFIISNNQYHKWSEPLASALLQSLQANKRYHFLFKNDNFSGRLTMRMRTDGILPRDRLLFHSLALNYFSKTNQALFFILSQSLISNTSFSDCFTYRYIMPLIIIKNIGPIGRLNCHYCITTIPTIFWENFSLWDSQNLF